MSGYKKEDLLKIFFSFCLILLSGALGNLSAQASDPLQSEVLSIADKVESENRFVDYVHPDSLASLPIGLTKEIGGNRYVIAIDSATFRPGASTFSAYMAMEFPGSQNKICFAAKNIGFNPKGVFATTASRLVLVSEHRIPIGPKVMMILKPDGSNYIEWDCNGFQAVNLKGYFEFDPGMIYGVSANGTSNDSTVRASFEIHCNDIHNFICQLNISPFGIRGMKGFVFSVTDATVDMSELSNYPTMAFPSGYNLEAGMTPEMWTGFYLKSFKVKLPPELKRKDGTIPEIFASNMILDNTGVTGVFGANNIFTLSNGSMSGWEFSLDNMNVHITQNHLNGGGLAGRIKIPVSKNTDFNYSATFMQNTNTQELDYSFTLQPKSNVDIDVFTAKITLNNNSTLSVIKTNGKFIPEAKLSGYIDISSADWKDPGVVFQDLVISNQSPYIKSGTFSLVGMNSGTLGYFPISVTSIGINIHPTAPALYADIAFNLMSSEDFSFSAETRVFALAKIIPPATQYDKADFQFDRVIVNNINFEVSTQPFYLAGTVSWKNNDPVYGKGFFGGFSLKIHGVLDEPVSSNVWFGSVNNMKYWYVDATIPANIPVANTVVINRMKGALYYHMHQNQSSASLIQNIHNNSTLTSPLSFTPDSAKGLGFKAAVYFYVVPDEKTGNGDVELTVLFNSAQAGGGLNSIAMNGNVWFLATKAERNSPTGNKVTGNMNMTYDHMTKTFHAVFNASVAMPQLTGSGQLVMHLDPSVWYVCVGRPSQRINVTVTNFGSMTAYFMIGQQLEPMPPPPSQVIAITGNSGLQNARNNQQLSDASGWVVGALGGSSSSGSFPLGSVQLYYGFWAQAGLDLMLMNYGPSAYCAGSSEKLGINGWYAQGQCYAYLSGNVGIRGTLLGQDFDVNILNMSAAFLLAGQAPRPVYLTGAAGCDYDILGGAISGHVDFSYSLGSYCSVQQ